MYRSHALMWSDKFRCNSMCGTNGLGRAWYHHMIITFFFLKLSFIMIAICVLTNFAIWLNNYRNEIFVQRHRTKLLKERERERTSKLCADAKVERHINFDDGYGKEFSWEDLEQDWRSSQTLFYLTLFSSCHINSTCCHKPSLKIRREDMLINLN